MAEQILSQNEIDALLAAVNEGDLDFEAEDDARDRGGDAGSVAVKYDLLSQDRIIRGRMPTLDIINDRFARQFRITLSNSLRKIVQVNVESTSLMKYGEFLNYLPIPSCLNLLKIHPLRGHCVLAVESKLIFAFLNNWFGGATNAQERLENRDFTAIELMIIKKVIALLMEDLQRAWAPVHQIQGEYVRTEVNPQFLTVVAPTDVVVLTSYEIEIDGLRGSVQLVIPYGTIEPIRQHLSRGIGGDGDGEDRTWRNLLTESLYDVEMTSSVVLGTDEMTVGELLRLKVGDLIMLDSNKTEPLDFFVESSKKFEVLPVERAGHMLARIVSQVKPSFMIAKDEEEEVEDDRELDLQ